MDAIAGLLTARLRAVTGDPAAERTPAAVQSRIALLGLQSRDVLGGLTVARAAKDVGSRTIVQEAVRDGYLTPKRVGRLLVIERCQFEAWKTRRNAPPPDYVQLSTLKPILCPGTDKLPEYAGLGYIPTAVRCFPMQGGVPSTSRGTWFISRATAEQLLADRKEGRPMPWFGRPTPSNLRATYRLLQERAHPKSCPTCRQIWGPAGAPRDFDDYARRYPPLDHGAKRHLTRPWTPGLSIADTARHCRTTASIVRTAIANGTLAAAQAAGRTYVTRTDATRWLARRCPTGDGAKSWLSLETAQRLYLFEPTELRHLIATGALRCKLGTEGAMRGKQYVLRHQCGQHRERTGFTLAEAARRVGVDEGRMKELLSGASWRQRDERIPLETIKTIIKRLASSPGYTVRAAAALLRVKREWVMARVEDGTIRLTTDKWDTGQPRITPPMLERLRGAKQRPALRQRLDPANWYGLGQATVESGVTAATLAKWAAAGEVKREHDSGRYRYERASLRRRALAYWKTCRFKRADRPAWVADHLTPTHAAD